MDASIKRKTRRTAARRFAAAAALIMTAVMLASVVPASSFVLAKDGKIDISDANMKKLEDQLKKIKEDDAALTKKIAEAKKDLTNTLQTKQYLDAQISLTEEKIETQTLLLIELGNQIHDTERDIENLNKDIEEKMQMVKDLLRFSYENGHVSYLEIVFDSGSFTDFIDNIERVGRMLEYQNELLEDLENQTSEATQKKNTLDDIRAKNDEIAKELLNDEANLNKQIKETANYITKLSNSITLSDKQKKDNEKALAEINKVIEEILVERQRQSNANYVGGDLGWPVDIKYWNISSGYGWRSFDNATHLGIDIPADYGAAVYAANAGTVVTATSHYSYGNYVLIDHGGGKATLYAHNSKLLVKEGDKVKSGQKIAQVGSTGVSSGNHVHFEVRIDGKTVNPIKNDHLVVVQPPKPN